MQVYLDVAQAAYEATRRVARRIRGHFNKEILSPEEHEEISKAFTSLLGRIGKLHLVASPKTMNAVNEFYNVLLEVYEGIIPAESLKGFLPPALGEHLFEDMKETDVGTQINRFETALMRLLSSMRKDLGYRMRSLRIDHNSFAASFFRDLIKDGKGQASTGETAGR